MQQIKIFKGLEHEVDVLEKNMNAWLKSSGAKVTNIFGNISPQTRVTEGPTIAGAERSMAHRFASSDVLIVVLYEGS
ncbi:MAG TPA: hypothetical protein VG711_08040 [Phycisphaerales bacterium]|nr:hypothetical protein [Phycisphaerales bacterium]